MAGVLGLSVALSCLLFVQVSGSENGCPCDKPELCDPIDISEPRKELFVFSVNNDNWRKWNWTGITTVISCAQQFDPELMCFAHAHKARFGILVEIGATILKNHTATSLWIEATLNKARSRYADAINIDEEQRIAAGSPQSHLLTEVVRGLTERFKKINPNNQVSFDFPWHCCGIYGRFYEENAIADIVDFFVIMSYDTQNKTSDLTSECVAKANIPYDRIITGYGSWMDKGIPASKLVMALPWYGYYYPCVDYDKTSDTCKIAARASGGCSWDVEYPLSRIMKVQKSYGAGRRWSNRTLTPFFTYFNNTSNNWSQIWYDDVESLSFKLHYATVNGLRGVSMWQADSADYSDDPESVKLTRNLWSMFTDAVHDSDQRLMESLEIESVPIISGGCAVLSAAFLAAGFMTGVLVAVQTQKYRKQPEGYEATKKRKTNQSFWLI